MLTREQIEEIQTESREKGISIKNLLQDTYSGRYPFSIPVIPVHFLVSKDRYLLRS